MRHPFVIALACLALSVSVSPADAEDIGGTINATRIIVEDSQLVEDVTCTMTDGPCIDFGAPGITLRLNGFKLTGPAQPDSPPSGSTFCNATSGVPAADGIRISNQPGSQVLGPGLIQRFRRHGILIVGTAGIATKVRVADITSEHNCFSGILTNGMSESIVENVVSVRNAINSGTTPCGGNCLVNSHNNIIRRSVFAGNGSVVNNDDFGVGLLSGSSGNLIEGNTMGGNANGVLLQATATGNTIRRNVIAGNPPSQLSRDYGSAVGADIRDQATGTGSGDRNVFQENWCVSYIGPGPSPCPNLSTQPVPPVVVPVACVTPPPAQGWVCVNGGWVPPDHPLAGTPIPPTPPPPPPPAGGCVGTDPFAAIPGLVGECINGGWVPRPSGGTE